ncbi:fibronectin type III domain-containing protein [Spirosoma aureum]|uniref:fibronectin type III domain-containing protein n=1 Tax=Spirosoma aureum TaxID=2692134 RepID=UPI001E36113B|nr:fibronectin type III domain-containing protein [Spirosoma aureum]
MTPAQALSLVQQANLALQEKRASGAVFTNITYIPIRPHIVRRSDGSGGLSLANLNRMMAATNSYYLLNGFGIQFYFAGTTPDYIDNDGLFNSFPYPEGSTVDGRDAANAMNQYYIHSFSASVGGYAYYPANNIVTTRSFIGVFNNTEADINDASNRIIPHELGHNFNLYHTFGNNNGNATTTELVTRGAGANCTTDGDLICDTPADPYGMYGADVTYVNNCPQYNPNSFAHDAHNEYYTPSITNLMSYYFPCTHDFTPGQYDRMQAGLALRQTHTTYTLDAPATNVAPVSNLTANFTLTSIVLNWQDNANNEMGYFIERSTSPTSGFACIGGVGPDVTTFTDIKFDNRTIYYYRIRPSNTTTGSFSSTANVDTTIPSVTGLNTNNITANSAVLSWNSLGSGLTYDVQWRAVGNATWTTVSNITGISNSLFGLTPGTAYEWQVKASASTAYSGPIGFSTPCTAPQNLYYSPSRTVASLYWFGTGSPTYTLQWRQQGTANWTTVTGITNSTYSLTGLTSSTAYEWQVQSVCSLTASSTYAGPQSFTTLSCQAPTNLNAISKSISAQLNWYSNVDPGQTFELRYRPVGAVTWTSVASLTTTTYSLTGLTNNIQYEWQVRSICSITESSDYSFPNTFTTFCLAITGLTANPTTTSANLYWGYAGIPEPSSVYELQYRPVGNPNWMTTIGYNSGSSYNSRTLTDLLANTAYEARIRTLCSPGVNTDYSTIVTFTTGCYAPASNSLYISNTYSSFVQLQWSVTTDASSAFDLRYRTVGATDWSILNGITTQYYSLTGLNGNTQYEWQIRTVCSPSTSSTFTPGPNFTTNCHIPSGLYALAKLKSATLNWSSDESGSSYDARYRQVGTTDWTTVSNLTSSSVAITGLISNISYEWQVRVRCANGSYSDFSGLNTFNTAPCSLPYNLVASVSYNGARLSWSFDNADANTRYEIQYRPTMDFANPGWNTLSNLTSNNGNGYVDISGLIYNRFYEWQIRTLCSPTESTVFSASSYFATQCETPTNLNVTTTPTTARLNWSFQRADADTRYEARYRVVGTTNWVFVGNLTSDTGVGYVDITGLTNNTQYEWQIRTLCSVTNGSSFTPLATFSTQCSVPTGLVANVLINSATLFWTQLSGAVGNYEVRYRLTGTTGWTTISNVTSTSTAISGLTANTVYDWQVRTLCGNNVASDFSDIRSFLTNSCNTPVSLYTSNLTTTSARINWSFYSATAETRYEARYRAVGTTDWATLSNLTSLLGSGYFDLTGLTETGPYEWQIRTICSPSESSAFSSSVTFRTLSPCQSMYTIKTGLWTDPAIWSCGRLPLSSDIVEIRHFVTVPANLIVFAKKVSIDSGQRLIYSLNTQLKTGF